MNEIILENACTGMFSDELDKMGFRNQVVHGLKLNNKNGRIYGKIRTIKIETTETDDENIKLGLGFIGKIKKGEILCVEGSREFAYFGELMTRLSLRQEIGGVVIGGLTRDSLFTQKIKSLIIFSEGYSPKDIKGRGRVNSVDAKIKISGKDVEPSDWLFGDSDGIVIIPSKIKDVLEEKIIRIISNEKNIIKDIENNTSIEEIISKYKEF